MRLFSLVAAVAALVCAVSPVTAHTASSPHGHSHGDVKSPAAPAVVEWTFLLFLNGNNNLDTYGTFNVNQMITVGSQPWLNIVVQQASLSANDTKRMFITKGNAQVVQDLGAGVEMGDVSTWEDFLQWGVANYPARHYLVSIWDHGTGWHYEQVPGVGLVRTGSAKPHLGDISCNDDFDRCISTTQLGDALSRFSRLIGDKVDIFATDACSMQMIEIATEVAEFTDYFISSETAIPVQGWPYDAWLTQWVQEGPAADPDRVAALLTSSYLTAYDAGGEYSKPGRTQSVTQSFLTTVHLQSTLDAIKQLGQHILALNETDRKTAFAQVKSSVCFSEPDSCDIVSFAQLLAVALPLPQIQSTANRLQAAIHLLVGSHGGTGQFASSVYGLAIWLPANTDIYYNYDHDSRYESLKFEQLTQWGQALRYMLLGK